MMPTVSQEGRVLSLPVMAHGSSRRGGQEVRTRGAAVLAAAGAEVTGVLVVLMPVVGLVISSQEVLDLLIQVPGSQERAAATLSASAAAAAPSIGRRRPRLLSASQRGARDVEKGAGSPVQVGRLGRRGSRSPVLLLLL